MGWIYFIGIMIAFACMFKACEHVTDNFYSNITDNSFSRKELKRNLIKLYYVV